jgi:hypothetical protein
MKSKFSDRSASVHIIGFLGLLFCFTSEVAGVQLMRPEIHGLQDAPARPEWGLFTDSQLVEVSLTFDITTFLAEKPADEYLSAKMVLNRGRPDSLQLDILLRARGNYRYRNCPFPPIRLNLAESGTQYSDLEQMDNLKMVTHCRDDEEYMVYLLREYLIYRLYNIITDNSFRVRLLRVHYIDTGSGDNSFTTLAFVIEPVDVVETRLKVDEKEEVGIGMDKLDPLNRHRLAIFQFMIANNDWFVSTVHNIKLFKPSEEDPENDYIALPYDFDYSGFVYAQYALPKREMKIEELRHRTYNGICSPDNEIEQVLDEFKNHRKDLLKEISSLDQLEAIHRIDLKRFIRSFYTLYHGDKIYEIIRETCSEQVPANN